MSKVSIIIPIYNVEQYLRECLDSVVNQTLKDIEIICVNDGSTDNSLNIIKEYANNDNRIKIIDKQNSGYGDSMNKGLDAATGEYIGIVEPDDFVELDMYEKLYATAKQEKVVCVKGDYFRYSEKTPIENRDIVTFFDKELFYNRKINAIENPAIFIGSATIWAAIYNRDFLISHNIKFLPTAGASYQDTSFWIKVLFEAENVYCSKYAGYHYRIDNPNSSVKSNAKIFCICDEMHEIEKRYSSDPEKQLIINSLKFDKYVWNYNRLAKKGRKVFLNIFLNELKDIIKNKKYIDILVREYMFNTYYEAKNHSKIETIFSARNIGKHKVITILGLKLKFKNPKKELNSIIGALNNEIYNLKQGQNDMFSTIEFLEHNIRPNSILLIEPNDTHGEVIPGYVKYFSDLGFNVDIIVTSYNFKTKCLKNLEDENYQIFCLSRNALKIILNSKVIKEYQYIFFTSQTTYERYKNYERPSIMDRYPILNQYLNKLFAVEHRLEFCNKTLLENNSIVAIAKLPNIDNRVIIANPMYFGNYAITNKNLTYTNFITVGALVSFRRNCSVLIDAVLNLHRNGIRNFYVTVIGQGHLNNIPKEIRHYFLILGKAPYDVMYKEVERADFFLPLLDPLNPEHERYITTGTSGSFQLIYGFRKPCLIAEKFANIHGFNSENSIVYKKNDDFVNAMKYAINMNSEKYKEMQNALNNTSNAIYNASLQNLKEALGLKNKDLLQE